MRIVLDTNVLLSALAFPGSKPDQIFQRVRRGEFHLILSRWILEETRRNLVEKFDYSPAATALLIRRLTEVSEVVEPTERLRLVAAKDDDNRILECAVCGHADVLVTGDHAHLLPLKTIGTTRILSPAEFLASLEAAP